MYFSILKSILICISMSLAVVASEASVVPEVKYITLKYLDYWDKTNRPSENLYIFSSIEEYSIQLDPDLVDSSNDFKISLILTEMVCRSSEASTTHLLINGGGGAQKWCETMTDDDTPIVFDGARNITIKPAGKWGDDGSITHSATIIATVYYEPSSSCGCDSQSFCCQPCSNSGYCINSKLKCNNQPNCGCEEDEKDSICEDDDDDWVYDPADSINIWIYVGPVIGVVIFTVLISGSFAYRRYKWNKKHRVVGVVLAGGAIAAVITERRQPQPQPTAPQEVGPTGDQYPHQQQYELQPQQQPRENPPPYRP